MGKIIAVWGSPNSGKTTLAIKLAQHIYEKYKAVVTILSVDDVTPTLPVLFPNKKSDDMLSVGLVLSQTEITQNDVMKSIVTYKGKANMGFMGFIDGENRYSYPKYEKEKVETLLFVLKGISDIVIVDCTSNINNLLTVTALKSADYIIRVTNPDLKSVSFFSSQLPLIADPQYKRDEHIICLNSTENLVFEPLIEATEYFKEVAYSFPFCLPLKKQFLDGALFEKLSEKKYSNEIKALAEKVV